MVLGLRQGADSHLGGPGDVQHADVVGYESRERLQQLLRRVVLGTGEQQLRFVEARQRVFGCRSLHRFELPARGAPILLRKYSEISAACNSVAPGRRATAFS